MGSYEAQSQASGRQLLPDLARAWAIFGIALVNVGVFAWPMMSSYHFEGGLVSGLDNAAYFAVNALFLMKSYSLFSLMFGVGFAHQMDSAQRAGSGFAGRYWRRLFGLLAFGVLNIAFLFIGDILVLYAVLGALLFLFRRARPRTLVIWAVAVYAVQAVIAALFALALTAGFAAAPDDMAMAIADMQAADAEALAVFTQAGFWDTAAYRLKTYSEDAVFMFAFQGFGAFAFMLLGLALARSGAIADPSRGMWGRCRTQALPLGLLISAAGAWLIASGDSFFTPQGMGGMALITLGSPFSTLGYLGWIARFAEGRGGPLRTFLARGGTATLSAYLLQGLIFSLLFSAYGAGLFAALPASVCIGLALLVALFTLTVSSLWRLRFTHGPLETILRAWTYLKCR